MKIKFLQLSLFISIFLTPLFCKAMEPGTLLYRTSTEGKMYGYTDDPLIYEEKGIVKHIYSGHVGIYIGQENGEDYVVEALGGGIVKTKAKYFVNEAEGEKFLGAKIPKNMTSLQRAKAVALAKSLAANNLKYDLDFKNQKGPESGKWTCVGTVEKIYESANSNNPNNLGTLEYDQKYYAVDITPDGFDNFSTVNSNGDCFSRTYEFSKIAKQKNLLIPAPELIGFNAGLEYNNERYIFLPYTQFLQKSLKDVAADIEVSSSYPDKLVRGKTPVANLILRWSLINNPVSSIKKIVNGAKELALNLKDKIFGSNSETEIVLSDEKLKTTVAKSSSSSSAKKTSTKTAKTDTKQKTSEAIRALYPGQKIVKSENPSPENKNKTVEVKKEDGAKATETKDKDSKNPVVSETSNKINLKDLYSVASTVKNNNPISTNTATSSNNSSNQTNTGTSSNSSSSTSNSSSNTSSTNNSGTSSGSGSGSGSGSTSGNSTETGGSGTTNENNNTSSGETVTEHPKLALINKIYSTGNNDWIEIFNPTDYDFDLSVAEYRLEKAKTAEDPSLIMRIGNTEDGSYPKGTIIKAKGKYLIVRDDASDFYKNKADAIAIRDDFSWTNSGYTIYLGTAALSSSNDEDIVDAVGFGSDATYFQGSGPAPTIDDNYILNRIDASGNNKNDYNLIPTDDPSVVINSNNDDTNNDNNGQDNNATSTTDIVTPDSSHLFVPLEPIASSGITDYWHFNECYGDDRYVVGRFDCGREIGQTHEKVSKNLSPNIDLNKFSMSFYYKKSMLSPRLKIKLENEEGKNMIFMLEEPFFQIEGLPNSLWRYPNELFKDYNWHQVVLTVDGETGHWKVYIDGQEEYDQAFIQSLPDNFNKLEVSGDMGSVFFDELIFWNRPLSGNEILNDYNSARQYAPITTRDNQKLAELIHFWDFNEGDKFVNETDNSKSYDSVGGKIINHYSDSWVWRKANNTGIINRWQKDLTVSFNKLNDTKDLSLAFWWRSELSPREGRPLIALTYNDKNMLGLAADYYNQYFHFNSNFGIFPQGTSANIPSDGLWHHLALTYDSYRYLLRFYVDGKEEGSWPFIWIKSGEEPNGLIIKSEMNNTEIDDLGIWQGTLSTLEVQKIYNNSK